MRILSILPFSPPSPSFGGVERQMHSLHKGLAERSVEVHVLADISVVGKPYQKFEGIPVWGVPFPALTSSPWRPGNLKLWESWRAVRKTGLTQIPRPDLIHATTFRQPALYAHWLARSLNVPWVVTLAGSGANGDMTFARSNWLIRRALPRLARYVSGVVALDKLTRKEALDVGVPAGRIEIIPNGLVLKRGPGSLVRRHSIVFIGRLTRGKRVDTLLKAYSQLQEITPKISTLVIAGDGEERTCLEVLVNQLGVGGLTEFLGLIPGPEDVLDCACCFINPSESEGLPNAVLEALAFGVPVILSDIPVHRELAMAVGMEDYLFPVGDAEVLANKLHSFLALGDSEKQILRQRCAEYAQQFTRAARDDAYLTLYRRIVNHS